MKIIYIIIIVFVSLTTIIRCGHSPTPTVNCGCNASAVYRTTYNDFLGNLYNGSLAYYTNNYNESAWYVGVNIPNTNYYGICKICNSDTSIVKAFTDTSSRKSLIPVKFVGRLKKLCPNERPTFGLNALPETVFYHITIDSIKPN
ncbi:MAG: hypothetical protein JST69_14650 [Bacteroidetes bacterium]|nr:hypothetical protein [Bacteroidota bacterium]